MIDIRHRNDRGYTRTDWLESRHTFSFGAYRDPNHMGYRSLRVINEDRVIPGGGFATHSHRDMEIISIVLSGALSHEDSLGTGSVIQPGEVQRMTAGTGITHSEFNFSQEDPVHFLQIWILPDRKGLAPGYEQKRFAPEQRRGRFQLIGDRHGTNGAVTIHQDVRLLSAELEADQELTQTLREGRYAWLHIVSGVVELNGRELRAGDGAAVHDERFVRLASETGAEVLLFDLA